MDRALELVGAGRQRRDVVGLRRDGPGSPCRRRPSRRVASRMSTSWGVPASLLSNGICERLVGRGGQRRLVELDALGGDRHVAGRAGPAAGDRAAARRRAGPPGAGEPPAPPPLADRRREPAGVEQRPPRPRGTRTGREQSPRPAGAGLVLEMAGRVRLDRPGGTPCGRRSASRASDTISEDDADRRSQPPKTSPSEQDDTPSEARIGRNDGPGMWTPGRRPRVDDGRQRRDGRPRRGRSRRSASRPQ